MLSLICPNANDLFHCLFFSGYERYRMQGSEEEGKNNLEINPVIIYMIITMDVL